MQRFKDCSCNILLIQLASFSADKYEELASSRSPSNCSGLSTVFVQVMVKRRKPIYRSCSSPVTVLTTTSDQSYNGDLPMSLHVERSSVVLSDDST